MTTLLNPDVHHTNPFFDAALEEYQDLILRYLSVSKWPNIRYASHLSQSALGMILQYPRLTERQASRLRLAISHAATICGDRDRYLDSDNRLDASNLLGGKHYAARLQSYVDSLSHLLTDEELLAHVRANQ